MEKGGKEKLKINKKESGKEENKKTINRKEKKMRN